MRKKPTIGLKRVERCVDARTSESRADKAAERGAGESQKDPGLSSVAQQSAKGDNVRNLAYLALRENDQFSQVKSRVCEMRYVAIHVACLIFVFFTGRLVVPRVRHGLTGTPRFFSAPGAAGLGKCKAREEEAKNQCT